MRSPLSSEVLLDVTLSAMCSRAKYRDDVEPVLEQLRATARHRTDILAQVAGSWAGYYERDATPELIAALLTIDGAEAWVPLGRRRRGAAPHGAPIIARRSELSPHSLPASNPAKANQLNVR